MTEPNPFEAIKQRKLMAELTANYAEAKRREARFTQTKYGFYDDDGVRQDGLIAFVRYFWDVLEPETAFVDGWPLWAICLPYNAEIATSDGPKRIGDIVETEWRGDVLSFNHLRGKSEWKPIVRCMKSPGRPLLAVRTANGVLRLTDNHPVFVVGRGYVRADKVRVGEAIAELQVLRQTILPQPIQTAGRVLLAQVFRRGKEIAVQMDLPKVRESKELGRQGVSFLLRKIAAAWSVLSMRPMWQRRLASAVAADSEEIWDILQRNVYGEVYARQEQSLFYQRQSRQSVSARILAGAASCLGTGRSLLLSVFGTAKEARRSSYRPEHDEQRNVEFGRAVPQVSLSATRPSDDGPRPRDGYGIGASIVLSIEREERIPDTVYNIEVLDNHNYFADGFLVHNCEHLEAVTRGDIHRLLITVPPGFMKSLLTDCFWPAWEWGPMGHAHYRYVTFSYSQLLTMRDNDRFRTLITSPKYQALYGVSTTTHYGKREVRNGIAMRNTQVIKVMNQNTGWKLASSTGGVTLGERGDRVLIDDPHNMLEAESDIERTKVIKWFRESVPSRLNNLDTGAIIIIMQRLHEDDVAGVALGDDFDYCHLMIPWEFDPSRAFGDNGKLIENQIGWIDPRADPDNEDANAGEPAWLERFSLPAMARLRSEIGPYGWASQFEQSPVPRGQGVFQPEWWKLYEHPNNFFPEFSFTCASLDGAFTQDETNDPSALTLWGVFDTGDGKRGVMLIGAWAKHLQFSSKRVEKRPMELHGVWRQRTMQDWGLMEWVYDSCTWLYGKPFKVDRLLIEDKGPGHSAAQELRNRYGIHDFGIQLVKTRGDKMARALAVQPIFSNGLVWAPKFDWSEIVIRQMSKFPYDRHDDLTDSTTQALRYLRDTGLLESDEERHLGDYVRSQAKPRLKALYPV